MMWFLPFLGIPIFLLSTVECRTMPLLLFSCGKVSYWNSFIAFISQKAGIVCTKSLRVAKALIFAIPGPRSPVDRTVDF